MRIILAGFNIDRTLIDELASVTAHPEAVTPETVAVAYARISRDPRPVTELRQAAIEDVEAARKSARSIVFGLNHQSVAEHAAFNFDVLDISRLCVEALEWHRLCSYTEKSQRYQELTDDHVIPAGLEGPARELFEATVAKQFALYARAFEILHAHFRERHPDMLDTKAGERVVAGYAKEDARYITPLATKAQLGFTANARNLEYIIRRLRAHPLAEARRLGEEFFRQAGEVAPALILLTDPVEYEKQFGQTLSDDFFTRTHPHAREVIDALRTRFRAGAGEATGAPGSGEPAFEHAPGDGSDTPAGHAELLHPGDHPRRGDVTLLEWPPAADRSVLTAILHAHSGEPAQACAALADRLLADGEGARELMREFLAHANPWESATREFEAAGFTFEVTLSAACYGQMKRHRMSTQLVQEYDPGLGVTIPPSVTETGLADDFLALAEETAGVYARLLDEAPEAAPYVLTNSHRRRMLVRADIRELYHISRLREDPHAQWDIRTVSADMLALAREKAPLALMLAWGKDVFEEKKQQL